MLQLSCTQKPASHDRQNGSKRCHGKEDFGMKVAMIGHKDFPSRSGGVEVMVGGLATSLVKRGYEVTVYNRGQQFFEMENISRQWTLQVLQEMN